MAEHHVAHVVTGEAQVDEGGALLRVRPEPHEHTDDGEPHVHHQPDRDERGGEPAPGATGDARGVGEVVTALEQRAEDAPAVERERGEEVEESEEHVHPCEPDEERPGHQVDRIQPLRHRHRAERGHDAEPEARERTGDGHRELVGRCFRERLEPGDAADRQQVDLVDDETVPSADEAVRQLVEEHAGEDRDQPRERRRDARSAGFGAGQREERDEQQEGRVHADVDVGDMADAHRPAPWRSFLVVHGWTVRRSPAPGQGRTSPLRPGATVATVPGCPPTP
jgi:hypothetical protein